MYENGRKYFDQSCHGPITSVSLLIGKGCVTVLVWGKMSRRLLNPYATAAPSSWKVSGRVHGSETIRASGSLDECTLGGIGW